MGNTALGEHQSGVNGKTVLMIALNLNHQTDSRTDSSLVNHMPTPDSETTQKPAGVPCLRG